MTGATPPPEAYPVDEYGFVHQCAWCLNVSDARGYYCLASAKLLRDASHGCCEVCERRFLSYGGSTPPRAA